MWVNQEVQMTTGVGLQIGRLCVRRRHWSADCVLGLSTITAKRNRFKAIQGGTIAATCIVR
jgi:hypothetical protein